MGFSCQKLFLFLFIFLTILLFLSTAVVINMPIPSFFLFPTPPMISRRKKSQMSGDFQRQIPRQIGRFCANFEEIFVAKFAEKQLVKNSRFCGNFLGKFG